MQSTTTMTTLRSFIMLLCMVAVPAVAILGTGFPKIVKSAVRSKAQSAPNAAAAKAEPQPSSDAPRFGVASVSDSLESQPSVATSQQPPAQLPAQAALASPVPQAVPSSLWASQPASSVPSGNVVVNYDAAAGRGDTVPTNSALHRPVGPMAVPTPRDPLTTVQGRLRELGATYWLLETWGARGELFRFHCKVSVSGNEGSRPFEATDADPVRAMQQVQQQIEAWQTGSTP